MCVLKCFSRFIVSFYVKDSVFLESFSFINTASRNVISLSETSAVNLLLNENCGNESISCLSMSHREKTSSMKRFHRFNSALAHVFLFRSLL